MASLNKVLIIGNLTSDAVKTEVWQGSKVSFSVAVNEKYRDKAGELRETTEYVECEWWNANGILAYLTKGKAVYVEGKLKTDSWEKDGVKHRATKVSVSNVQLIGGDGAGRQEQRGMETKRETAPQDYAPQTDDLPF